MKIWLVNPFEAAPNIDSLAKRYSTLADTLSRRGHEICLWTSDFSHFKKDYFQINKKLNYQIETIHAPAYHSNTGIKRLTSHAQLGLRTASEMKRKATRIGYPDLIVMTAPPLEVSHAASRFARKHHIPYCIDITDTWPDSFELLVPKKMRPFSGPLLWPYQKILEYSLNYASAIVAISETYKKWANDKRKAKHKIPQAIVPWAAPLATSPASYFEKGKTLELVFVGTLGVMYNFDLIYQAAEQLNKDNQIQAHFSIVGDGPRYNELKTRDRPSNIDLLGPLFGEELDQLLRKSHIGLCSYRKDAPQSLPIKLYHYASYGLAMIENLNSEMGKLLKKNQMGRSVENVDHFIATVKDLIQSEQIQSLQKNAYFYASKHTIEYHTNTYADFLLSL